MANWGNRNGRSKGGNLVNSFGILFVTVNVLSFGQVISPYVSVAVSTEEMLDSENQRMTESLAGKVSQLKSVG